MVGGISGDREAPCPKATCVGRCGASVGDDKVRSLHNSHVIMSTMASKTTRVSIVYSIVCSGIDQRKHQSSASLAFVQGTHR